jgi:hypothetical protein
METWRNGEMETWRHGDMEIWRHRHGHMDMETLRHQTKNVNPGDFPSFVYRLLIVQMEVCCLSVC